MRPSSRLSQESNVNVAKPAVFSSLTGMRERGGGGSRAAPRPSWHGHIPALRYSFRVYPP